MGPEGIIKSACGEYLSIMRRQGICDFWYNYSTGMMRKGRWVQNKSKHTRNGVSDIICVLKGGHAVFIEVKSKTGAQSDAQKEFQRSVESFGADYLLVKSTRDLVDGMNRLVLKYGIRQNIF